MDYRTKKARDLIKGADNDWNYLINNLHSSYFEDEELFDEETKYLKQNKLAEELALICEKYLKAIYLKNATIPSEILDNLQDKISRDSSRIGEETISENDIVDLITSNDNARTKYLFGKLTRQQRNALKEVTFRGISHEFTKIFKRENMTNFGDIKNDFLYSIIQHDFDRVIGGDKDYIARTKNDENEAIERLSKKEVNEAFEKGRYAELSHFEPDIKSLIYLTQSLQRNVTKIFDGLKISESSKSTFNLSNTYAEKNGYTNLSGYVDFGSCIHIFPDIESDIKIIGKNKHEEYSFGTCLLGTIYKTEFEPNSRVSKMILKTKEELNKELRNPICGKCIGLFSKDNKYSRYFMELNKAFNKNGFLLDDGDIVSYVSEGNTRYIANIRDQIEGINEKYANKKISELTENDINRE